MPHFRLISFDLCPYVQRCVVTLSEKGIDHDVDYIDLRAPRIMPIPVTID